MQLEAGWFRGTGYAKVEHALQCWRTYAFTHDPQLLDDVIALTESAQAEAATPAGLSATHFLHGRALRRRYDLTGSLDDLTWALRAMRQATEEDPAQDRADRLELLGGSLLVAIELLEPGEDPAPAHLALAEGWLREAISLLPPARVAMARSSLGLVLFERCRHFGSVDDWRSAVRELGGALDAATDDGDRARIWGNLGKVLIFAFNRDPSAELAGQVLRAFATAAAVCPAGDPQHAVHQEQYAMVREMLGVE